MTTAHSMIFMFGVGILALMSIWHFAHYHTNVKTVPTDMICILPEKEK